MCFEGVICVNFLPRGFQVQWTLFWRWKQLSFFAKSQIKQRNLTKNQTTTGAKQSSILRENPTEKRQTASLRFLWIIHLLNDALLLLVSCGSFFKLLSPLDKYLRIYLCHIFSCRCIQNSKLSANKLETSKKSN